MRKFVPFSEDTNFAPYIPLPAFIMHEDFSYTAKLIYCFMLHRATNSRKNGAFRDKNGIFIHASIQEMCDFVKRKEYVVKEAVKVLDEAGYIKRKRMGRGISNKYYVYIPIDNSDVSI